jgi:hypothetical protein
MAASWVGEQTSAEHDPAERVLQAARASSCWIACACNGEAPRALMAVYERDRQLYLRRMTGERPLHAPNCVFYREQTLRAPSGARIILPGTHTGNLRPETPPPFYSLDLAMAVRDGEPDVSHPGNGSRRSATAEPTLARRMRWLLDQASANVFPQPRDIVSRLIGVCKAVAVGPFELSRYAYFSPKAYDHGLVSQAASRALSDGLQDYAYLVAPLVSRRGEQFDECVLRYKGAETTLIEPPTTHYYGVARAAQLPMLAVYKVNANNVVTECYAHPVYSEDFWCLVDSHEERQALRAIITVSATLRERYGIRAHIVKPLYAFDDGIIPDLLVEFTSHDLLPIAIEVLGYEREDYRLKKSLQALTLAERYHYIAYDIRVGEHAVLAQAVFDYATAHAG